jgi:hypothetical protein
MLGWNSEETVDTLTTHTRRKWVTENFFLKTLARKKIAVREERSIKQQSGNE